MTKSVFQELDIKLYVKTINKTTSATHLFVEWMRTLIHLKKLIELQW